MTINDRHHSACLTPSRSQTRLEASRPALPRSSDALIDLVQTQLQRHATTPLSFETNGDFREISAVLVLLASGPDGLPTLILNKRSKRVRQSGDLCCPGGGIEPLIDRLLARWFYLPVSPLSRWPHGPWWRRCRGKDFPKLALILAAALREGFEEMRLNPLGIRFLGPMPVQHLVLFKRAIYPLVAWVNRQHRFFPNWEVEKIVRIPLEAFLDADNYARLRFSLETDNPGDPAPTHREMPCFRFRHNGEEELLWGVTFRIVTQFLATTLGHVPPPMESSPLIRRHLDRRYMEGTH